MVLQQNMFMYTHLQFLILKRTFLMAFKLATGADGMFAEIVLLILTKVLCMLSYL